MRRDNALLALSVFLFLFLFLFTASFAASPSFSPYVTRSGFSNPSVLTTNQSEVSMTIWTGTISADAFITSVEINIAGLNPVEGQVLSVPEPTCPSGISTRNIINEQTLLCSTGMSESGIAGGSNVPITLTLNRVKDSVGTNPNQISIKLVDEQLNETTMLIDFTIQNKPALASSVAVGYPATVSKGQIGVPVTFRTINTASSPAAAANSVTQDAVIRDAGGAAISAVSYTQTPSGAISLGSGQEVNFTFYVDVPVGAAAGLMTHWFNLSAVDPNSGRVFTSATVQNSTTVLTPPNLNATLLLNNTAFISNIYPYNTALLTVRLNNTGEARANLTGASLVFLDSNGLDRTANFIYANTTQLNASIPASATTDISFNVTGIGSWAGGAVTVNYTVYYVDGGSGLSCGPYRTNHSNAFTYDTVAPLVNFHSYDGNTSNYRDTQDGTAAIVVNATDSSSGLTPSALVLFTAKDGSTVRTTNLSCSPPLCSGTVDVDELSLDIYGDTQTRVVVSDAVGNNATATASVFFYNVRLFAKDGFNNYYIEEPNFTNPVFALLNMTNGERTACLGQPFGSSLCAVPFGTVVNVSLSSVSHVWNQSDGNRTLCIGTGTTTSCNKAFPSSAHINDTIYLLPNTLITLQNEFGIPVKAFNVTVRDSLSWFVYLSDGAVGDENSSDGALLFPFDTGKHQTPFTAEFNVAPNYNNTGLSFWTQQFTPSNATLTTISKTSKFSVLFNLLDEFGNAIDRTGGSAVYNQLNEFGFSAVACVTNPVDNHVYGCRIPTAAEVANASYPSQGASFSVSKPGYVDFSTVRVVPPTSPASAQVNATARANFTILIIPTDAWNVSTIDGNSIDSVISEFAGACYRNGTQSLWGCPATSSDTYVNVTPVNSSGFLNRRILINPSQAQQKTNYSASNYTLEVNASEEVFGGRLHSNDISQVLFNGSINCIGKPAPADHTWGCPVPIGTALSPVYVNTSSQSGYLSATAYPSGVISSVHATSPATASSTHNYTVRVNTTNQFGSTVSSAGGNVSAYLANTTRISCVNTSLSDWFCAVPVSTAATVRTTLQAYISANNSLTAPANSGNQSRISSGNLFTAVVYTRDELGNFPDLRTGSAVSLAGYSCVNNSVSAFLWGCAVPWSTSGNATISASGMISWNSGPYITNSYDGPQISVQPTLQYTLLVNLTDQIGNALSGATVTATNSAVSCYSNLSRYYCPVSSASSAVTASKVGFVNRTVTTAGISSAGPQTVLQMTYANNSGLPYSASIRVTREVNNSNIEMSQDVSFINATSGAQVFPAGNSSNPSTPNIFYFAFPEGSQELFVRKAGYVDKQVYFTTSQATPYDNSNTSNSFSLRIYLHSESGAAITSGAVLYPYQYHQDGSYYYFAIPSGTATVYAGKTGYVNNSTTVSINTTYPQGQVQAPLKLQFTLKVVSVDWGGASLNGTTVNVTYAANSSLLASQTLSSSENTAYFDLSHTTPAIIVSVSKANYNTVGFGPTALSQSSQASMQSAHAQNIIVNLTDWGGAALGSATATLYRNDFSTSNKIAKCTTLPSGLCTFTSYNGVADPDTSSFNSSRVSQGDLIVVSADKPGFGQIQTADGRYYYQNSSTPLPAGTFKLGAKITVFANQAWGSGNPIAGATISLKNTSNVQIASITTNSTGGGAFSPNYYASNSPSDSSIASGELQNLANYAAYFSKLGYSNQTNASTFNSSLPKTLTFTGYDSAAPVFTFYWPDGSVYDGIESSPYNGSAIGLENFTVNFSVSDPYGTDGSGVNLSNITVGVINSTQSFQLKTLSCPSGSCSTSFSGKEFPVQNLTLRFGALDNFGNGNTSDSLLISIPAVNVTGIGFVNASAYSNGLGYWNFSFNLALKGAFARMKLSDFTGLVGGYVNITDPSCAESHCANLWYYNATSCAAESVPVYNEFNATVTPYAFCDRNLTTTYLREQTAFLVMTVPPGAQSDKYNASYGFAGGGSS
ncbi:MAG: hypothetical protein V1820_03605 [archaeon]